MHGGNDSQFEDGKFFLSYLFERERIGWVEGGMGLIRMVGAFGEYCVVKGDLAMKVSRFCVECNNCGASGGWEG